MDAWMERSPHPSVKYANDHDDCRPGYFSARCCQTLLETDKELENSRVNTDDDK